MATEVGKSAVIFVQSHPVSSAQVDEQPSPDSSLPSSQASPGSMIPSPHLAAQPVPVVHLGSHWQVGEQPS